MRSWLTLREPLRDSWNIVNRIGLDRPRRASAPRVPRSFAALRADLGEQHALQVADERELAFLLRNVADRPLQREHALRPLELGEPQAPVDHLEHVVRI